MLAFSEKIKQQLARWKQIADLQLCLTKKKPMNQKTLLCVSKIRIFWNICAFLLLLATRPSNRFFEQGMSSKKNPEYRSSCEYSSQPGDRSLSFSRYQINIFLLDFPFLLLSISQNLGFCIYDCFFWVGFAISAVKYFSKLKFCIYDCTFGLDFSFPLLSISQN